MLYELGGAEPLKLSTGYDFWDSGSDGIITVYGAWLDYLGCAYSYRSTIDVRALQIQPSRYTLWDLGLKGNSKFLDC